MEKMLQKLARQLDSLDEASLMDLWSKYATITSRFEPTHQWEESVLVFSLIQAKRWKNQLFNSCWSKQRKPDNALFAALSEELGKFTLESEQTGPACRVLAFPDAAQGAEPAPADDDNDDK